MGVNVSKVSVEQTKRHKEIEAHINDDRMKMQSSFKLLLLGPGESGKSTIVKQMRILHTGGFSDQEIQQQRTLVAQNILTNMIAMIRAMSILGIDFEDPNREMEAAAILKSEENWAGGCALSAGEWSCIKLLWADRGIQQCFKRANEYQLGDSAKYFCDDLDRISQQTYVPTYEDILRTRASTLGIVEITFPFRDLMLTIIDVGGQRSQRKKWIHCFEGVNCLIYVASLSEYDQVLFEDATVNRMEESLKLFGTVCNCKWFHTTPTILFLNKKDVFADKLEASPLKRIFPDYTGDNTFEPSSKFLEKEFHKRRENQSKDVYTHKTCATDTKNIQFVMGACFDIILAKNMKQAGFAWLVQV